MERDTIAQRLSALRKEVFMAPHSPVADPARLLTRGTGIATLHSVVGQPVGRRTRDTSADTTTKRLASISPRPSSGRAPNGSPARSSSPGSRESSTPPHGSFDGGADGGPAVSNSSSGKVDGRRRAEGTSKWASTRPSASPSRRSAGAGPVRVDVRLPVPSSGSPAAVKLPERSAHEAVSKAVRSMARMGVTSSSSGGSGGYMLHPLVPVEQLGDVGGSPPVAESVVVDVSRVPPCGFLPAVSLCATCGLSGPCVCLPTAAAVATPDVPLVSKVLRTTSAVQEGGGGGTDPPESRVHSAPLVAKGAAEHLNGPRAVDPMSPRAVARATAGKRGGDGGLTVALSQEGGECPDGAAPKPPSTRRRTALVVSLFTCEDKCLLPPNTPIVGSATGAAASTPYIPTRPSSEASILSPSASPRRMNAYRPPAASPATAKPLLDTPKIAFESPADAGVSSPRLVYRSVAPAGAPLTPQRPASQPIASSPRCALGRGTPKAPTPPPAAKLAVPSPGVTSSARASTGSTPGHTAAASGPPAAVPTVKRGAFTFDDDDIVASDIAHGYVPEGAAEATPAPAPAPAPTSDPAPASTPSARKRRPALALPTGASGPAEAKGEEAGAPAPQPFTPFPTGLHFDVDVELASAAKPVGVTLPAVPVSGDVRLHRGQSPPPDTGHTPSRRKRSVSPPLPHAVDVLAPLASAASTGSPGGLRSAARRGAGGGGGHRRRATLPDRLRLFEPTRTPSCVIDGLLRAGRETWREYKEGVRAVVSECEYMGVIVEDSSSGSRLQGTARLGRGDLRRRGSISSELRSKLGALAGGKPTAVSAEFTRVEPAAVLAALPVDDWYRHGRRGWHRSPQSAFMCGDSRAPVCSPSPSPAAAGDNAGDSVGVPVPSSAVPVVVTVLPAPLPASTPAAAPAAPLTATPKSQRKAPLSLAQLDTRQRGTGEQAPPPFLLASPVAVVPTRVTPKFKGGALRVEGAADGAPVDFSMLTSPVASSRYTALSRSQSTASASPAHTSGRPEPSPSLRSLRESSSGQLSLPGSVSKSHSCSPELLGSPTVAPTASVRSSRHRHKSSSHKHKRRSSGRDERHRRHRSSRSHRRSHRRHRSKYVSPSSSSSSSSLSSSSSYSSSSSRSSSPATVASEDTVSVASVEGGGSVDADLLALVGAAGVDSDPDTVSSVSDDDTYSVSTSGDSYSSRSTSSRSSGEHRRRRHRSRHHKRRHRESSRRRSRRSRHAPAPAAAATHSHKSSSSSSRRRRSTS